MLSELLVAALQFAQTLAKFTETDVDDKLVAFLLENPSLLDALADWLFGDEQTELPDGLPHGVLPMLAGDHPLLAGLAAGGFTFDQLRRLLPLVLDVLEPWLRKRRAG